MKRGYSFSVTAQLLKTTKDNSDSSKVEEYAASEQKPIESQNLPGTKKQNTASNLPFFQQTRVEKKLHLIKINVDFFIQQLLEESPEPEYKAKLEGHLQEIYINLECSKDEVGVKPLLDKIQNYLHTQGLHAISATERLACTEELDTETKVDCYT